MKSNVAHRIGHLLVFIAGASHVPDLHAQTSPPGLISSTRAFGPENT